MSSRLHDLHSVVIGVALKLVSVLGLAGMAACVKYLGAAVPSGQVVFFRGTISMLVIAAVAWCTAGLGVLRTKNWRAHAYRSLAGSFSMFCWFISLTMIPLARMTAISFTVPLFLTVLALVVLGERIRWYRWTALAVGFAGVVAIVGPELVSGSGSAAGSGIALMAAIFAAFALMFLRRMSLHEHALTITFYFFLTSSVLALLTLPLRPWPMPAPEQWLALVLTGLLGVLGQLAMTYSYRYAEASLIAPLDYVSLLVATTIGYLAFDEIPGASFWIGAPLVILAGAIILWREYRTLREIRSAGPIET